MHVHDVRLRTNSHNSYVSLKVIVSTTQQSVGMKATVALKKTQY